jgi:hypothetical protein
MSDIPVQVDPPASSDPSVDPRIFLIHNWISWVGFFVVCSSLLGMLTFVLFSFVAPSTNPYVDIVGYMVLPGALIIGMIVVPAGMVIKYLRLRRTTPKHLLAYNLRLDLSMPGHRKAMTAFVLVSGFVMLPVLGVSSYHGYHYTDSTEFCAKACHSVMEPQGLTHTASPHARVTCAECHIGSGAGWFVQSKLSGTRQVIAVARESYSRPIPPAITELRPARDTCEQCHWPAKFFGSQLSEIVRYSSDEANSRRVLRLLVKTGGADEATGRVEGIHMHMALAGRIEYVAVDHDLQDIPWVRYIDDDGVARIFRSDGRKGSDPRPDGIVRGIDCMDCHNRSAHYMRPPQESMDLLLESGRVDRSLPFIKREAVAALAMPHADVPAAKAHIESALTTFYQSQFPEVWKANEPAILAAVEAVKDAYTRNTFPGMKVDWRTYPDNVGHMNSPGCFRCHDGRHVDDRGVSISSDCQVCHTFLNPVEGVDGAIKEGRFFHHMPLAMHENLRCNQCHTGGPIASCKDCHATGEWLDDWKSGVFVPKPE